MDVCLSMDEELVLTACSDKSIYAWNAAQGQLVRQIFGHTDWYVCGVNALHALV